MKKITINYKELGKAIKEKRLSLNITQEKLAETANLSATHISNIENGKTKISLESLVIIANCLSCTVDSIISHGVDNSNVFYDKELLELFIGCTFEEKKFVIEIIQQIKKSYNKIIKPLL